MQNEFKNLSLKMYGIIFQFVPALLATTVDFETKVCTDYVPLQLGVHMFCVSGIKQFLYFCSS